jgi:hypothetical protein
MLAALNGHLWCVRKLCEAGAEPGLRSSGWSPLTYAAFSGRSEIVEYLLEHRADVDAPIDNGSTALMLAARNGHKKVVEVLLKHHADPGRQNDAGVTALGWALENGHMDIVGILREAGGTKQ